VTGPYLSQTRRSDAIACNVGDDYLCSPYLSAKTLSSGWLRDAVSRTQFRIDPIEEAVRPTPRADDRTRDRTRSFLLSRT